MRKRFLIVIPAALLMIGCSKKTTRAIATTTAKTETKVTTEAKVYQVKVNYYFQNIENDEYTLDATKTEYLKGKAGTSVSPVISAVTGFTCKNSDVSKVISENESENVINVYYDRVLCTISYKTNIEGVTFDPVNAKYGSKITAQTLDIPGYTISSYRIGEEDFDFDTVITSSFEIECVVSPNTDTAYTIRYYLDKKDSAEYEIYDEIPKTGTTDTTIDLTGLDIDIEEGTFKEFDKDSYTIKGDGSTVINIYYDRHKYDINFNTHGGPELNPIQVKYGYVLTEPNITRAGYTNNGWTSGSAEYDFTQEVKSNLDLSCTWTANTNTAYIVRYYLENIDNDNYSFYQDVDMTGTTDTSIDLNELKVTMTEGNFDHFGEETYSIKGDGSTIVEVYYKRKMFYITYHTNCDTTIPQAQAKYGTLLTEPALEKSGYDIIEWTNGSVHFNFRTDVVTSDLDLNCSWTPITHTLYKVKHYLINPNDDDYSIEVEEDKYGTTDTYVDAEKLKIDIPHASYSHYGEYSYRILGDGTTIVELYYIRDECLVEVTTEGAGIDINVTYDHIHFKYGATINLVATFDGTLGYVYDGFYVNGVKIESGYNYSFTVTDDVSVVATSKVIDELENFEFSSDDKSLTIIRMLNAQENVVIPDIATGIAYNAFSGNTTIKSLTIGENVKIIDDAAFNGCTNLTSIIFASNSKLEEIGYGAFVSTNLSSLSLPNSLKTIGGSAFNKALKNMDLIIPASVTEIGDGAFYDCALNNVTFGSNSSIEEIGEAAFEHCKINSITIPKSVKTIGDRAFCYSNIRNLVFEDESLLESIGEYAFMYCDLVTLNLPNNVATIGKNAFSYNSNLAIIYLNSDATIGTDAFRFTKPRIIVNNSTLTITIGSEDNGAIARYASLVLTKEEANSLIIEDDFIYNVTDTEKELLLYFGENKNIILDDTVTIIKGSAFTNNTIITSVIIPDNVWKIETGAFSYCSNLYTVSVGSGVTEIGNGAFYYTEKLYEVNNKSILVFEKGSQDYGSVAKNALFITDIVDFTPRLNIVDDTFVVYNSETDVTLVKIINYTNNLVIPSIVTIIGDEVLNTSDSNINKITIGKNVKKIGTKAFYNCTYLCEVEIEEGSVLETIGNYAFSHTRIDSIDIPECVTSIGDYAFEYCSYLIEVNVLGENINTIGKYAFANCGLLHIFHVTENVSLIDTNAFDSTFIYSIFNESQLDIVMGAETNGKIALYACEVYSNINDKTLETVNGFTTIVKKNELGEVIDKYLLAYEGEETDIVIPNDITIIEKNVFMNYASDFTISFEESSILREIKTGAFYNTKLQSIEIPSSIEKLGYRAIICKNLTRDGNFYYAGNSENPYVILYEMIDKNATSFTINDRCRILADNVLLSSKVENLVIPDSVVFIGEQGLYGCDASSITLSNNLKSLEDGVFKKCDNLTTIVIPSSVEFIEGNAFDTCVNLEYVYFADNSKLKVIGKNQTRGMFYQCDKLKEVVLPYGLEEINVDLFMPSSGVTRSVVDLVLPGSIRRINGKLKYTKATNIYFNGTAGDLCRIDYKYLESIFMNKGYYFYILDENGSISFKGNNYGLLTEVVVPEDVTELKIFAFHSAYNLISLKIHSGVTRIDNSAFFDTCLSEVYNESDLTIDTSSVNFGTVKAVHQSFDDESNLIITDDGFVFIKYNNTYAFVRYIGPLKSNYVMPESFMDGTTLVTSYSMAKYSLGFTTNLKGVVISNSISGTVRHVAIDSSNYKNLYYDGDEEAWEEVENRFSWLINSSTTVYFYSETAPTDEGNYWCYYNGEPTAWSVVPKYSLTTTINDPSMGSINYSYDNEEIYGGTTITLTATPNSTYEFKGWYVDDEQVWVSATYEFVIDSNLTIEARFDNKKADSIDEYVISDGVITGLVNSDCVELVIPESVSTIGESAFESNTYIQTVVLPSSITTISNKAFKDCTNLTNVYFNGTIDEWARISISSNVSNPCYKSGNLYIFDESGSITHNGKHYSLLVDLVIPDGVEIIGQRAFANLTCIKTIIIPDSVTVISTNAFYQCINAKTIVVGKNISTVQTGGLGGLSSLEKIFYHSSYDEAPNVLPTSSASKYYYSETQPTDTTHNYWHYVGGVPTPW